MMWTTTRKRGLTLVELLVALSVSSVILAAVATLAYALGRSSEGMDNMGRNQAQVRYATLRLTDMIRQARLVCYADTESFALWAEDDDGNDQINVSEIVYVDKGEAGDMLRLCQLSSATNPSVALGDIGSLGSNWWTAYSASAAYTVLIPSCSNVQFGYDALPPAGEFVTVSFELSENGRMQPYEVCGCLRGRAENLLNAAGDALISDDD